MDYFRELDRGHKPLFVTVQWLEDTQLYNEWANELDYLVDIKEKDDTGGLGGKEPNAMKDVDDTVENVEIAAKVNGVHATRLLAQFKEDPEAETHLATLRVYNEEEEVCPAVVVRRPGRKHRRVQGKCTLPESPWGSKRPRTANGTTTVHTSCPYSRTVGRVSTCARHT
jgi:hypothetical protein